MRDSVIRIAFDLRWVGRDRGGIRTHALNLFRALVEPAGEFRFAGIVDSVETADVVRNFMEGRTGWDLCPVSYGPYSLRTQVSLPRALEAQGFAVLHVPEFLGQLGRHRLKTVITVHDLIPYLHPQLCPLSVKVRLYPVYARLLRRVLRTADAVIVVSEATRTDLAEAFPEHAAKACVVYNAVAPTFFDNVPDSAARIRSQYGIEGPIALFSGRQVPSKNVPQLIRAIDILRNQGSAVVLLVAGAGDARYPEPERLAWELKLQSRVKFLGYVGANDLRLLYQAADVFVFPSSYEGFGLPVLEAMASGTPVVTSACASLPEIVGDAAVFVEPQDPASIAHGIQRVLSDEGLRRNLIQRGKERARQFTWEAAARKVLAIYRQVLKPGSPAVPDTR